MVGESLHKVAMRRQIRLADSSRHRFFQVAVERSGLQRGGAGGQILVGPDEVPASVFQTVAIVGFAAGVQINSGDLW